MAKLAAADAALAALDQAIQTHGGNGMATEYGLATLWGITRLLKVAPVSREMIFNFVAQHSLGSAQVLLSRTGAPGSGTRTGVQPPHLTPFRGPNEAPHLPRWRRRLFASIDRESGIIDFSDAAFGSDR